MKQRRTGRAVAAFAKEMRRADQLTIPYLIMQPPWFPRGLGYGRGLAIIDCEH
jgi:hypothetical protein